MFFSNFLFLFLLHYLDLNVILNSKRNKSHWLCPIESQILIWNRYFNDSNFKERFDILLTADW